MKFNQIIPATIIAIGLLWGMSSCGSRSLENQMKTAVTMLNAALPMDVDEFTRVDSISLRGKDAMVYHYTINFGAAAELFEGVDLEEVMRENVIESIKYETELKVMKDLDMTFVFSYRDPEGNTLFEINVPPALYRE